MHAPARRSRRRWSGLLHARVALLACCCVCALSPVWQAVLRLRTPCFRVPAQLPECRSEEPPAPALPPADGPPSETPLRLLLLSTYPPTRCGLATFSAHLRLGLLSSPSVALVHVAAVHTGPAGSAPPRYPPEVVLVIRKAVAADYAAAAASLDRGGYHALLVQHEFGIHGGVHGEFLLELLLGTRTPVVTTPHTVEGQAHPLRVAALAQALRWSAGAVSLAGDGCQVVGSWAGAYGTEPVSTPCTHISHGVAPPLPCSKAFHRARLGLPPDTFLVLTGGLLSPGKGTEAVVDAWPAVLAAQPKALLLIVGAPHPADAGGGAYMRALRRCVRLSPARRGSIRFVEGYLSDEALQRLYAAAHVFVAAHSGRGQRSSGTLADACAAGCAAVATPFPAALHLPALGAGILVPFDQPAALRAALAGLAAAPERAAAMGEWARVSVAGLTWPQVGLRYAQLARAAAQAGSATDQRGVDGARAWLPRVRLSEARLVTSLSNGLMRVYAASNPGWVDGQGPGWALLDTWVARRRSGWGEDAVLLKGTLLSYSLPGEPRQRSLRLFEDGATSSEARGDGPGGGPGGCGELVQTWSGALPGAPTVRVHANRTLSLAPRSAAVRLRLSVAVAVERGAGVGVPSPLTLSPCLDQLTAAAGDPAFFAWAVQDAPPLAKSSATRDHKRRRPRAGSPSLQLQPEQPLRLVSRDSRGCATQLDVRAMGERLASAELRMDARGHPHALVHTYLPLQTAALQATRTQLLAAEVLFRWSARQEATAPPLCMPALDEP